MFLMPALITLLFLPAVWRDPSIEVVILLGVTWMVPILYYTSVGGEYEQDGRFLLSRLEEVLQPFGAASTVDSSHQSAKTNAQAEW